MDKKNRQLRADHRSGRVKTEHRPQSSARTLNRQSSKVRGESTQNTIPIAEIKDGVVILKDGSFRSVVRVEAVNFDLMSLKEKEAVELVYQAFLNSLYFPIQISIQSRHVNTRAYLKRIEGGLKDQNNMLLSILMEDYLEFVAELIENTDIMKKQFYVIIPFYGAELFKEATANSGKHLLSQLLFLKKSPGRLTINERSMKQAKKELRYRTQTVIEGLRSCGLSSHVLTTKELISLYYEFYNPDNVAKSRLINADELMAPYVKKKVRNE